MVLWEITSLWEDLHRITKSLRLENTSRITQSSCLPTTNTTH